MTQIVGASADTDSVADVDVYVAGVVGQVVCPQAAAAVLGVYGIYPPFPAVADDSVDCVSVAGQVILCLLGLLLLWFLRL